MPPVCSQLVRPGRAADEAPVIAKSRYIEDSIRVKKHLYWYLCFVCLRLDMLGKKNELSQLTSYLQTVVWNSLSNLIIKCPSTRNRIS